MDEEIIICRCEDLTLRDIREAISQGFTTLEEIKRVTRCGMGPCQGRTCLPLVAAELARARGKGIEEILPCTMRPPLMPLKLETISGAKDG
jgi:bacterioferritin-associated ferredoxin